tara:strand:+ start:2284 stop:2817 length:534 start_codon:yes stop_codon:yes gene_type:complete
MSLTLFDLTASYQDILERAADGEEGWDAALDELRGTIEEKAESYAFVIKTLEAEANVIKEEAKKLAAKAQHRTNAVERIKDHLQVGLEAAGIDKVKGSIYTVALQHSPWSVEVVEPDQVPFAYRRFSLTGLTIDEVPPELRPRATESYDRTGMLGAHEAGNNVPGAHIFQRQHLRIR